MKPGYGLELVQTQKLVLTPEMRQALLILQMNGYELSAFLRKEVEGNPLLEIEGDPREEPLSDPLDRSDDDEIALYFDDGSLSESPHIRRDRAASHLDFGRIGQEGPSLREHLMEQFAFLDVDEGQREIGEMIIGNLDDNGYLRCSTSEIAAAAHVPQWKAECVLRLVQSLDPPGIAARDLRECLSLQARALGLGPVVVGLIEEHLEDLGRGCYQKIARRMGVSSDAVIRARGIILRLNPKPGAQFSKNPVTYVHPDVSVRDMGGQIVVWLNEGSLPSVKWNPYYTRLLRSGGPDVRPYLLEEFRRARSLLRSIEQRKSTILKVMNCVFSRQTEFVREGPQHIWPLTMREVAHELRMSESTVSRSVSNKYVDTPYGVYPCKAFFSPRVKSQHQEASQQAVKKTIEALVKTEDPRLPMSDSQLMRELRDRGFQVARRTVAKYRARLGIPPASKRRLV